jgi:hypothetical protein
MKAVNAQHLLMGLTAAAAALLPFCPIFGLAATQEQVSGLAPLRVF